MNSKSKQLLTFCQQSTRVRTQAGIQINYRQCSLSVTNVKVLTEERKLSTFLSLGSCSPCSMTYGHRANHRRCSIHGSSVGCQCFRPPSQQKQRTLSVGPLKYTASITSLTFSIMDTGQFRDCVVEFRV